ncbi:MAG: hypothetical protein A2623_05550 [Caulobacterales bacterium RIFCSPHIGHO2_01_FULL_70_19]|nr:MAG: hypothetical protein A2623_05550 [Caulobacterales bacterium RIFCSPHIGHO2_01_FULL_70_19]
MARAATTTLFWFMALMGLAVALFSARFLLPGGFMTEGMAFHLEARPAIFLAHVVGGATALGLGAFQLATWRGPRRTWHRRAGRVYVAACLIGAAAGFGLAVTTSAGPVASLGFGLLAVAWFGTTFLGWRRAVSGEFGQHRRWMIRSLSLTFAAVTLRLMLPMIPLTGLDYIEAYRLISFLCWIPNLLLAELWLRTSAWETPAPRPR